MKALCCLFVAALMGLTSCIKNDVAPEVSLIRQAQVDKMKAEIANLLSNKLFTDAGTRAKLLQLRYDSLNNILKLEENKKRVEYLSAYYTALTRKEEANLADNDLAYEKAIAAYEKFITEGTFAVNVADYLTKYENAYSTLSDYYEDRLDLIEEIAQKKLLLTDDDITWDIVETRLQKDLTKAESELAAMNSAFGTLKSVMQDPASLNDELLTLDVEIKDLKNQIDSIRVAYDKAYYEYEVADQAYSRAGFVIDVMEGFTPEYGPGGYLQAKKDYTSSLEEVNIDIALATAALAPLEAVLTSAKISLTAATAAYNTKLAEYNTALANDNAQINIISEKQVLLTIAQNNKAAGDAAVPALTAAQIAALQAAVDAAQTAYNTASTDRTKADGTSAILTAAFNAKNTAGSTMNLAQDAVVDAQDDVDNQNGDIADLKDTKADYEADLKFINSEIAKFQTEYDAAKLAYQGMYEEILSLEKAYTDVDMELERLKDFKNWKQDVKEELTENIADLEKTLNNYTNRIEGQEDYVSVLNQKIAQNSFDKAWAEGEITMLEDELAALEQKIVDQEAVVAYYKNLLDSEIDAE